MLRTKKSEISFHRKHEIYVLLFSYAFLATKRRDIFFCFLICFVKWQTEVEELRNSLANVSVASDDGVRKIKENYLQKLNDLEEQVDLSFNYDVLSEKHFEITFSHF